ncbi:hypothetical protein ACFWGP_06370, partial [Agromyces sp. NPDC127015]
MTSSLSGAGGMAGDDNAAEEFCQGSDGYDALAGPTIDGVRSFANGLRILDAGLSNSGRAYDGAQKPGAGLDPATAQPATATPFIDESKSNPPDALGAGWPGPLGEFQELIEWGLAQVGVVIPTGDEDKLANAAEAWGTFASSVRSAKSKVSGSMSSISAMTVPQQQSMLSCRQGIASGLGDMVTSAEGMQTWISDFRTQLRDMREELGWFLKQMAIEIAAELAIGGLLSIVTAGIGALATAAKVSTTIIRWCVKIAKLIERLRDFLRGIRGVQGVLVRGGLRAAKEGLQAGLASAISTASVNAMRSGDKDYTSQDVGTAFLSAFAGGAVASPLSRVLGGSGGPGLRNGLREVAGETGAGAVDGLASSAVESAVTGEEFNPISDMVLGALLGGSLTAGGRGINALRPGGSGHGPSATETPGIDVGSDSQPTPGGGSGSSNQPAGSGPVDVSNDSPTPGAGDAGGSGAGDGSPVEVSNDAPTPGSGDAGGSGAGDGSPVEVSNDAPTPGSGDAGGSGAGDGSSVEVSNDAPTPGSGDAGGSGAGDGSPVEVSNDAPTPGSGDAGGSGAGDG